MKLTKAQKAEKSQELAKTLSQAPHFFLTDYKGLKFMELDDLRRRLRPSHCRYSVIKNSTLRYALKGAGVDGVDPKLFEGPVGLVFSETDEPSAAAKVLAAFAKEFPLFKIRTGYVARQWMTAQQCAQLAALGARPEILSRLAGVLYAAVAQAAGVLQAPIRDFALILKVLEEQKKTQGAAAA